MCVYVCVNKDKIILKGLDFPVLNLLSLEICIYPVWYMFRSTSSLSINVVHLIPDRVISTFILPGSAIPVHFQGKTGLYLVIQPLVLKEEDGVMVSISEREINDQNSNFSRSSLLLPTMY